MTKVLSGKCLLENSRHPPHTITVHNLLSLLILINYVVKSPLSDIPHTSQGALLPLIYNVQTS